MAEARPLRPPAPVRWAKVIDQTRCIGCHACSTACKSENEVPLGVHAHLREVRRRRPLPAGAPRVPGHALQPVRGRALRLRVPDRGDVPAAGRHRRLRQVGVHRLQGLHRRLPVRRDLHQPRGPLGREVQLLRAPARRRPRARVRRRLPDGGDPRRRPGRRRLARLARSSAASRGACAGPRRRRARSSSTGARTRRRSTRWRRAGPRAACTCGASSRRAPRGRLRSSGLAEQRRGGDARLRRPAPGAVGLAGEPLHLDEGHRGGRLPRCAALLAAGRCARCGEPALALGGAARGRLVPGGDRRRSSSPTSTQPQRFYLVLHAPAVAELARARRLHPLALRRRAGRALPGGARRERGLHACARLGGHAARRADAPSTPPSSSRRPRRATSGRARSCRRSCWCRRAASGAALLLPLASAVEPHGVAGRSPRPLRSRRTCTCCSSRARSRCRTAPRTRGSPCTR